MTMTTVYSLILLTLWIKLYGYQMVMGNSQASAKDFVFKAVRAWIIIAFATGLAASMGFSIRAVTTDLSNLISSAMTGSTDASKCTSTASDSGFMGCKIDQNLIRAQAAMAFVNQLDTGGDPVLEDKKSKASLMTAAGIGGPAIVAGAFLLTLKVAMALFISLGPIFIMCLLFKQTSQLFWKWLYYGLSTMFATAMLAVVSDISMDLVENISGALFVTNIFNSILGGTDATAGVMQASLQQFGLGLILSTLLITTPPMAGSFFSQMMGQFQSQSAFQHWAGGVQSQAPQGNLGSAGVPTATVGARGANGAPAPLGRNDIGNSPNSSPVPANAYIPQTNAAVNQDVVKTSSAVGNARVSDGFASSEVAQSDKSIKDQVVKAGLIVVSGALLWANGGAVKQVNAEPWGDGVCRAGWYVDDHYGCVSADGACYYHPNGASNPDCSIGSGNTNNSNGGFNTPIRQEPSSYGAVAWDLKKGYVGTASQQASKQAAIDMAMQRCGTDNCEIIREYANQCMAIVYGAQLKGSKSKSFLRAGLTKNTAEKNALAACHKGARDCKIFVSECSLP